MPDTFIGTDIVSISRIKKTINSSHGDKFTHRIFTEDEIIYCSSKVDPIIHFSGRFAAKEAITKAILSSEIINSINMKSIEIISGKNGKPEVILRLSSKFKIQCKVSISHTDEYAIAFALLEML